MPSRNEGRVADLVEARRETIAARFVDRARAGGTTPEALPVEQVVDSLPDFVDELVAAVRGEPDAFLRAGASWHSRCAPLHARQRFELGYDVGALIREYAQLRDILWEVIEESGDLEPRQRMHETRVLFDALFSAVADAAVEYGRLNDAEMNRRTAQHIGFLAHELRNPIGSACLALGIIRERGEVTASRALDALERGLNRLSHLIDDSLVTVRLTSFSELHREPMDVADFLRDVASDSQADADAKGVTFDVAGSGHLSADKRALRSALSNLIRNAVKFSHKGGHVHVRAREVDGRIVIEVEDSCGGLPEGTVKKLFDPFVQAGTDRTGFGLGLAIAKQAVSAHMGELRVHDLPGKGCVFVLDLPVEAAPLDP